MPQRLLQYYDVTDYLHKKQADLSAAPPDWWGDLGEHSDLEGIAEEEPLSDNGADPPEEDEDEVEVVEEEDKVQVEVVSQAGNNVSKSTFALSCFSVKCRLEMGVLELFSQPGMRVVASTLE
eukprot:g75436.t1